MATLVEILTRPETRPRVVRACTDLIAAEVESKGGLGGVAVKGAYRLVQAVKPGMVGEVVDRLLPEFAAALEAFYAASVAAAEASRVPLAHAFTGLLGERKAAVAEALLGVTDRRAQKASGPLQKTYSKLRSGAHGHVEAAVPGLGRTLAPFL